jgi:arsenical resistance protein ArsH
LHYPTGTPHDRQTRIFIALGCAQTLAWGSTYYLPAIMGAPMAHELGVSTGFVFGRRAVPVHPPNGAVRRLCAAPVHRVRARRTGGSPRSDCLINGGTHMRLRTLSEPDFLPALDTRHALQMPANGLAARPEHPPRILLLYGSLRERSYSRLVVEEAARLVRFFGAEPRIFDPSDLPLPDQVKGDNHPAVHELRELSMWSEGQIWCSPERHGQITGVMKTQIDHLPLNMGGMRPTQGRTLAVMQISGGSQSFNAVNTLRLLGRWMRMVTIPNQSSVAKAFQEFDDAGRMKPSGYYERIVDVVEELIRFTVLLRPHVATLTDRYSERKEAAGPPPDAASDLSAIATTHQREGVSTDQAGAISRLVERGRDQGHCQTAK